MSKDKSTKFKLSLVIHGKDQKAAGLHQGQGCNCAHKSESLSSGAQMHVVTGHSSEPLIVLELILALAAARSRNP